MSSNQKGTAKPYVKFISGSATGVTGSAHLVRFKNYGILLDCGLEQGHDIMTDYQANKDFLHKLRVKDVQYIILSHVHCDHSSLIPALFAKGCQAHVYVPVGSKPLLRLLWADSLKIHQSDCLKLQKKHGHNFAPFFTENDIDIALGRCIEINLNEETALNQDVKFKYLSAGHIIYSAQIYLELHQGYQIYRVGFSGDIGGLTPRPFTLSRQSMPFCNLMIGECTYNTPTRPNNAKDRDKDIEKIATVVQDSSKVLFPTFSLQRTQELLQVLYTMWKYKWLDNSIQIYLDSPLASRINDAWLETTIWKTIKSWPNLHVIQDPEDSRALQTSSQRCIIISASGFLNGGRILGHLTTALPDPKATVMFIGYAGENNLASKIKANEPVVEINGVLVENKAKIVELRSFSSHASYEELMAYYTEIPYNKICLVHGEMTGKVEFAKSLKDKLASNGKSARVIAVNADTKIYI